MTTHTSEIELSPAQLAAIDKAAAWYESWDALTSEPFHIFGYAGTGKTTLYKSLIRRLGLTNVVNGTFTGKAALVMRKHGTPASTLHSLTYRYLPPDKDECNKLFDAWKKAPKGKERTELKRQLTEAKKPRFELNPNSDLIDADLLGIDEVSMVNAEMRGDIESFGVPIIVLGDPGQLPPIEGTGAFLTSTPEVMLTEIHRQAQDSPIISLATRARNGIPFPQCTDFPARVMARHTTSIDDYLSADQVLCGKNDTRRKLNQSLRAVQGREEHYPMKGDKLICLRNEATLGLFNGLFAEVLEVRDLYEHYIELLVRTELDQELEVQALRAHFDVYADPNALDNVRWWERTDTQEFDYGYAITVHKSQGSQWENVVLYDDKFLVWNKKERARWLYTAVTRAADKLTVVQ